MNPGVLVLGIAVSLLGGLTLLFFVIAPPAPRIARDRRVAPGVDQVTLLGRVTAQTTAAVDSALAGERRRLFSAEKLDLAGIRSTPSQFLIFVASAASVFAMIGVMLGFGNGSSALWAVFFAILTPVGAKLFVGIRASRRRAKFADQIDDMLQLVAGSLRAGHGLSTALAAIAAEADAPMGEELTRAVNESRLGRPLPDALAITAQRMQSKDFDWVAQAIAINAETGGNLAEVLNQVAFTIRERNEIRRQVAALSAEGRLSGMILVILPIALFLFFSVIQPTYTVVFFQTFIGIIALIVAGILLVLGSVWVAFTVRVKF
ncbi:type II secretion system F family protein [Agromyces albus]|uniref:type II secretion system F family protein n=1 Tax=Agromyces albus TaxID=205332 RepID=UPI002781F6A9|nr:type II secretion system F family protein [Agromyces albus]MDQ0573788.1 Flp pilus assembly protein TadB [Agromyces albus]